MKLPDWPKPKSISKIYLGLDRIRVLLDKLGNPQKKMSPIFHIAGTNGKGSVSSFLKYILEENGYKVHRNTSPHLVRFNERIEVCGKEITDEYYNELAEECKYVMEKNDIDASYFEIITAIAFMAFAKNDADATILEVGMGGRLVATNIVDDVVASIITSISLDHVAALGDTVEKISLEKIAIAKNNCPIIIGKQEHIGVIDVMKNWVLNNRNNCKLFTSGVDYSFKKINKNECEFCGFSKKFHTQMPSLEGMHQLANAEAAIAALLCQNKLKINEKAISGGVAKTFWKARLQNLKDTKLYEYVKKGSELYIDGAHNEGGAAVIRNWLLDKNKIDDRENILIISMLERKDSKSFVEKIKGCFDRVIIVSGNDGKEGEMSRYKTIDSFTDEFKNIGVDVFYGCDNIVEALRKTNEIKSDKKLRILICGSLYFCGDVLSLIESY